MCGESCGRGYRAFLMWNALRFGIIAGLVAWANFSNDDYVESIAGDCCRCYDIAHENEDYLDKRFDLSYCIPKCADCTYCATRDRNATDQEISCPAENYSALPTSFWQTSKTSFLPKPYFSPRLEELTGCTNDDHIAITSSYFWNKSYIVYANLAIGVGFLYAMAMIFLALCCTTQPESIGVMVFIYNWLFTQLFLYLLYKPYQYSNRHIPYDEDTGETAICEVNTVSMLSQDILHWLLFISSVLLGLQLLYFLLMCCECLKKCCTLRKDSVRYDRAKSYNLMIDADNNKVRCRCCGCFQGRACCEYDKLCVQYYMHLMMRGVVVLLMVAFVVVMVWADYVLIEADRENWEMEQKVVLFAGLGLLALALFDILFFPFCGKTTCLYCKKKAPQASADIEAYNL